MSLDVTESEATLAALRDSEAVQLWTVELNAEASREHEYWQTLSGDERARAERFRFARDRNRYIRARGKLRSLLGEYLSQRASEIVLEYGPQGKPAVASHQELQFNVAHSGDYALYAFCAGRRVGADIEQIRAMDDQEAVARRFFSPEECDDLMGLPKQDRSAAFFAGWTRKEAFVKAVGTGLTMSLQSFRVSLLPDAKPALLRSESGDEWTLFDTAPAGGYRGAVAVEGSDYRIYPMKNSSDMQDNFAKRREPSAELVFNRSSVTIGT